VSGRCKAVVRSRRDNVGTESGQSQKSDKCGATEWRDFKACFHALRQNACGVSGRCKAVVRSRRDNVGTESGQSRKSDKCGATEWRDFKACFHALRQSACSVFGRCEAVAESRCDSLGTGSDQSRKSDKFGATEWRDFEACFRAMQQSACGVSGRCEAVAQSQRDNVVTGSGQCRKVTNAARLSGGTSALAVVRCIRVNAVCLDDARQWRARDGQCGEWIGSTLKKCQMRRDRVDGLQILRSCAATECMRCVRMT
jgi:hypothetical protein